MVSFYNAVMAMTHEEVIAFVFGYWGNPTSFYYTLNRWMYDGAVKYRKTDINQELDKMAIKRLGVSPGDEKVTAWGGYKNVTLTDDEIRDFDQLCAKGKYPVMGSIDHLVKMGKLSVSHKDGTFNATVTVVHDKALWAISAFSDSSAEAIQLLAHKVIVRPEWLSSDNQVKRSRG